ncbi:MAG: 3-hydroxybutyryl-CoA dehydrogenase [Candidatus Glassbacteria bacterium]|nr:3-hydroxybutyryl-CoA dehydrogenase [Candidatus Glassbacteria bacterium]
MEQDSALFFDRATVIGINKRALQIAETFAAAGIEVMLAGPNKQQTEAAMAGIGKSIDREIERWGKTESDKRAIMARITPAESLESLKDCKIAVEAMGLNFQDKRGTLERVEQTCTESLELYVIHISTLSVTEIAGASRLRDKVIGMHFLEPVPKIPMVELVRGMHTSDETVETAKKLARLLNKTAVEVFEYPGYITTRVMLPMINEAIQVLMEGIASAEDIDTAIKLGYNLPVGPLTMADELGLETVLRRMDNLFHELGDVKFRPSPLLRKMVRAGKLGRSMGEGFFKYETRDAYESGKND